MADPTLHEALRRAKNERDALEERLKQVKAAIDYFERMADAARTPLFEGAILPDVRFAGMSAPEAVLVVLGQHGKPMHVKELVSELLEHGYTAQKDPTKLYRNIFSALRRNPTFVKTRGRATFGLREWEGKKEPAQRKTEPAPTT